MESFLDRNNCIAVIGATTNTSKWGYKVFVHLHQQGYKVCPVNPKYGEIDGLACYPDLASIPHKIDMVVTVVKPMVTEEVVRQAHKLGIKKVWMQPGSESGEAIMFGEERGMDMVHNACMVTDGLKQEFN